MLTPTPVFIRKFRAEPSEVFVNRQQFRLSNSLYRIVKSAVLTTLSTSLMALVALGQNNPVPQIVGPVHPMAVTPGSGAFPINSDGLLDVVFLDGGWCMYVFLQQ